jgi:hypothetical protein
MGLSQSYCIHRDYHYSGCVGQDYGNNPAMYACRKRLYLFQFGMLCDEHHPNKHQVQYDEQGRKLCHCIDSNHTS